MADIEQLEAEIKRIRAKEQQEMAAQEYERSTADYDTGPVEAYRSTLDELANVVRRLIRENQELREARYGIEDKANAHQASQEQLMVALIKEARQQLDMPSMKGNPNRGPGGVRW